jgi:hypothetical protein
MAAAAAWRPNEARLAARRAFGGIAHMNDRHRDAR